MVEQDLVLSRALVALFREPVVRETLLFRGGTALYKLHVRPAARFSEDIDLVQARAGPIGPALTGIRRALDPWLGRPRRTFNEGRATVLYRFGSEGIPPLPLRLKVEVNTREHFTVLGVEERTLGVESPWFAGEADIPTYALDELLGTKMRALHQRRKGRDLFDLATALGRSGVDAGRIVTVFQAYLAREGRSVSRAEYEETLLGKLADPRFADDVRPLLVTGATWDARAAAATVLDRLVARLPGEPWKGAPAG